MTGAGDPSATVNLVRKKPTKDFKASISATAGSWDDYRTEGDISGSLTDSGNVRGRFVGAYQDKDSYIDHYSQKKDLFYGILEADLSDDTLLTFGVDKSSATPRGSSWTGNAVYFADGGRTDFPRSFNPGCRLEPSGFRQHHLLRRPGTGTGQRLETQAQPRPENHRPRHPPGLGQRRQPGPRHR